MKACVLNVEHVYYILKTVLTELSCCTYYSLPSPLSFSTPPLSQALYLFFSLARCRLLSLVHARSPLVFLSFSTKAHVLWSPWEMFLFFVAPWQRFHTYSLFPYAGVTKVFFWAFYVSCLLQQVAPVTDGFPRRIAATRSLFMCVRVSVGTSKSIFLCLYACVRACVHVCMQECVWRGGVACAWIYMCLFVQT